MDHASDKLRFLARQARTLAKSERGQARSAALRSLANLYEEQAAELELRASGVRDEVARSSLPAIA